MRLPYCIVYLLLLLLPQQGQAQTLLELALGGKLTRLLSKPHLERLQRYRPLPPFDESPFYSLIDTPIIGEGTESSQVNKALEQILFGPRIELSPRLSLNFDGLLYMLADYNYNDGFWLGYETMLEYQMGLGRKLIFRSSNNYTLKSHKYYHEHRFYYYFAPEQDGFLLLSAGETSRETLPETKGEIYQMKYLNPLGTNSKLRNYDKTFVSLRTSAMLLPQMHTMLALLYEKQKPYFLKDSEGQLILSQLNLSYDFAHEAPISATFPSGTQTPYGYGSFALGLNVVKAFEPKELGLRDDGSFSHYTMLEGSLRSAWADELFLNNIALFVGGFVGSRQLSSSDIRLFRAVTDLSIIPFDNAWATLHYDFILDKQWAGLYWNGQSQNLLLGRSFIGQQGFGFDESLHLKLLTDMDKRFYTELGYSIGWDRFFRLGLFVGSDFRNPIPNLQFSLNLPISLLASKWGERY